jgi:hypothetical protein
MQGAMVSGPRSVSLREFFMCVFLPARGLMLLRIGEGKLCAAPIFSRANASPNGSRQRNFFFQTEQ